MRAGGLPQALWPVQPERHEARDAAALLLRMPARVLPPPHGLLPARPLRQLRDGEPVHLRRLLCDAAQDHAGPRHILFGHKLLLMALTAESSVLLS